MKIDKLARIAGEMPYLFNTRELWNKASRLTQVNILEPVDKCLVSFANSGTKADNFKIDLSGGILNISSEAEEKINKRAECDSRNFSRSFSLLSFFNMKKVFALIALITILSTASFAQIANLNITLSDVLSFSVTQPGTLDVNFDTEDKYTNGIIAFASDHVSVTSSKGYIVKAIAGTVTGLASISPGTVKITSTVGATNNGNTTGITYGSAVVLPETGGTAATVIAAANTSWNGSNSTNKFNISYLIGSGGAYAGKPIGLNVVPVVYTVTQQ